MDYVLTLPLELSRRLQSELETIEEELNMPYVTSIERLARQEGIEQGMQRGIQQGRQEGQQEGMLQGVRDLLRQTLEVRFGELPETLLDKIEQCQDVAALRAFHQQALTARAVDELQF